MEFEDLVSLATLYEALGGADWNDKGGWSAGRGGGFAGRLLDDRTPAAVRARFEADRGYGVEKGAHSGE